MYTVEFNTEPTGSSWVESSATTVGPRLAEVRRAHPDSIAIVDTGEGQRRELTYVDLDDAVTRVSGAVIERTVGGARVGVLTEDTVDHLIALLGVMRAGRVAVPLDPANPKTRLQHMVEHSDVSLILVSDLAAGASLGSGRGDTLEVDEAKSESSSLSVEVDPSQAAQILYTSGSTGAPKGVVQSHSYLVSRFRREAAFYGFGPNDRLSQVFPISFAASNGHSFGALMNGATLFPYDIPKMGLHRLAEWANEQRLSGLAMVPTLFRRAFGEADLPACDTVRYVMLGGEVALVADHTIFRRYFDDQAVLIHRLASTETDSISYHVLDKDATPKGSTLLAGLPAPGKTLSLVDDAGAEVDPGEIGELLVTADDLSEGYWDDASLTAASFVPGPGQSRTYRTGDLARLDGDGNLIHQGRKDGRIKIRGFGVDVIEVERALLEIPGIEEGVVQAYEDAESGHVLIGFFVSSLPLDTQGVRRLMLERVPDFMAPAQMVQLEAMPLSPRGKIDRTQLERPPPSSTLQSNAADMTPLVQTVHDVWAAVLGRDKVPTDQSFFDLGGNSLGAYELIGKLHTATGVDLAASSLLTSSTIESQVALIEAGQGSLAPIVVPIRSDGEKPSIFGIHGRGGGIVYLNKLSDHLDARFPLYGLQPASVADQKPAQMSVEQMAESYLEEVTKIQTRSPYLLLGSCFGGLVAWEMARRLAADHQQVPLLVLVDPPRPGASTGSARSPVGVERIVRVSRKKLRVAAVKVKYGLTRRDRPDYGPRYQDLSKVHAQARRDFGPQPSSVPVVVLAAKGKSAAQFEVWNDVARGGLEIEEYPAIHPETWTPWNRKVIARMLNARLAKLESE